MNKFDEQRTVQRIRCLYLERLLEKTPDEVRKMARNISRLKDCSVEAAYERMEGHLLDTPPPDVNNNL